MNLVSNLLREAIKRDSMTPQYRWVVKAQFTSHTFRLGLQGMLYYTFLWCFSLMATTSFPRMSFPYLNLVSPMCSIDIGNVCQLINFHTDLKCSVHNVNLKWHPLVFKWESVWFVWNIMSRSSQLVVNTSPNDFMIDWWLHKRIITWGLHNFSCFCVVLFCLVWVFFGGGGGVCGFSSHSRTVHSYGEVTITGEGLQIFIYYHFSNSETLRFSGLKISHDDHIIKPTTG